jgi:hypothetical protein
MFHRAFQHIDSENVETPKQGLLAGESEFGGAAALDPVSSLTPIVKTL